MLLPTNFLIGVGLLGAMLLATRFASLGRKLMVAVGRAARDLRVFAARKLAALSAGSAISAMGCGARRAGRHRRARRHRSTPDLSAAHGIAVFRGAADRVIAAAALARRYPNARIIYSGGSANLISDDAREADYAGAVFESLGIAKARLTMERRSRNTQENAEFSKAMAAPKSGERWLLVTSAYPYAAIGRPVSKGRICRRAVSGRLAGRRPRRSPGLSRSSRSTGWIASTSACANGSGLSPTGPPARSTNCSRGRRRNRRAVAAGA